MSKSSTVILSLAPFALGASLGAQTPPAAPSCPRSSALLAARPIKGVDARMIAAACPAFLRAVEDYYAAHPTSTAAQLVAALTGSVPSPSPFLTPPPATKPVTKAVASPAQTLPASPSGQYAPPNILNNASFETGWDGFINWKGQTPTAGGGVVRDNAEAFSGKWSVLRAFGPTPDGDGGAQFANYLNGHHDRVWVRFYFKATNHVSSVMKFMRYYDDSFGQNFGGFGFYEGTNIFRWSFNQENSAIDTWIGLSEAQVIDAKWHSMEVDYWRNGDPSGFPSTAFWFDGNPIGLPDGDDVGYPCARSPAGATCSKMYWKGGRLYAGERKSSVQMFMMEWLATLNRGNTASGEIRIDRIAISAAGRIGP